MLNGNFLYALKQDTYKFDLLIFLVNLKAMFSLLFFEHGYLA